MDEIRQRIDTKLGELLPAESIEPTVLHTAMRYSVFSGGKRIRPILCVTVCQALGGTLDDALVPACAIEALHTYTLIHDDLPAMDDDDMRRGRPTCHKQFNEATAILAGDALLTIAFEWLGMHGDARLVQELAQATGSLGVVGGQQSDMDYKDTTVTREQLLAMQGKKTANLLSVSCVLGAMCAGVSASEIEAMRHVGDSMGRAFQLLDDLCDNDPVTMSVIGREETMKLAQHYQADSYDALRALPYDTARVKEVLDFTYASF